MLAELIAYVRASAQKEMRGRGLGLRSLGFTGFRDESFGFCGFGFRGHAPRSPKPL